MNLNDVKLDIYTVNIRTYSYIILRFDCPKISSDLCIQGINHFRAFLDDADEPE